MAQSVEASGEGVLLRTDGTPLDDARFTGDITIAGVIHPDGGIHEEQISFTAAEMSTAAAINLGSGVPRWTLPDAATTSVYTNFSPPNWWDGFNYIAVVVNDHTATGNVRIQARCRETDLASQAVSAGGLIIDSTTTIASPSANGGLTFFVISSGVVRTPGLFGSLYSFEFTRLGSDGADTLAGPLALCGLTVGRV